jgi:enamine deaminase RidA (YjgF/YER057c/UK114 family)
VHQVTVTNSQGAVLSGVTFISSNPAVVNINSAGSLIALTQGTAQITAAIGATSASLPVTVTAIPRTISDVYTHFPFAYVSGPVALYSDISPAFSQQNGAGLTLVWNYFSKLFRKSYGGHAVVYYTSDQNLYALAYGFCNPNGTPPGTQNTSYSAACNDPASGIQALVMMPTFPLDTERLQDEIGHQFLYATYPQSFAYPWVYEGLGLYWEAGTFDSSGNLVVQSPGTYLAVYEAAKARGSTVSLDALVHMSEATFYSGLYSRSNQLTTSEVHFAQADAFMYYLFKKFPNVMAGLIKQWNSGTIATNDGTITYITTQTGMTLAQLDAACSAYALRR